MLEPHPGPAVGRIRPGSLSDPVLALAGGSAVQAAEWLADALERPLVVAVGYRYAAQVAGATDTPGASNRRRARAARWQAEGIVAGLRHVPSVADVVVDACANPLIGVGELARSRSAVLTVVDASALPARSGLAGLLVAGARCPVVIVRGPAPAPDPEHGIGVAAGAGPAGRRAVDAGADLAHRLGVPLHLLRVAGDRRGLADVLGRDVLETAGEQVDRMRLHVPVKRALLHGDPAGRLAERACDLGLLVTGTPAGAPMSDLLLDGTAGGLLRSCPCPLMVVGAAVPDHPVL